MTGADPVRERVEATLRRILDDLGSIVALPCGAVRRAGEQLGEPASVVRSVVALTLGGLLGRGTLGGDRPAGSSAGGAGGEPVVERPPTTDGDVGAPPADRLPIDDYESLAASQVVARLERLDPDELRLVAEFEAAHRGRRTVLGKIGQLSGR